jgi:hypothetical protein
LLVGASLALVLIQARTARADEAAPARRQGLAVLALPGATDAAWPLAKQVYASPALHPSSIDEAHARVLAGEALPDGAAAELRDLAETRAAVKGDDAPSRQLLASIARSLGARGVVVVELAPDGVASARVFLADTSSFDAARYAPDPPAPTAPTAPGTPPAVRNGTWNATVESLARAYGTAPPAPPASSAAPTPAATTIPGPTAALQEGPRLEPPPKTGARKFYESPWFWGALGVAAFAGGAVYFATRDNGPGTIHLQMQVPK